VNVSCDEWSNWGADQGQRNFFVVLAFVFGVIGNEVLVALMIRSGCTTELTQLFSGLLFSLLALIKSLASLKRSSND
jgi:hypothetical protein